MRLTGFGWAYLVLTISFFLISVHFANNFTFALFLLLLVVGFVTLYSTVSNMRRVGVACLPGQPVFAGGDAAFEATLINPRSHDKWAVTVSPIGADGGSGGLAKGFQAHVSGKESAHGLLHLPAAHRGAVSLAGVKASSRFPLGIFEASRTWVFAPSSVASVVYPQPKGLRELPAPEAPHGHQTPEDPDDFAGLRAYQARDKPSQIAWRASSGAQGLLVKQFEGGAGDPTLWLDWASVPNGDTEFVLSQLCLWVLGAERAGAVFGLAIPGVRIPPGRGDRHSARCLKALALFEQPGAASSVESTRGGRDAD